jgi:uncharacterized lipoprotein YbaY
MRRLAAFLLFAFAAESADAAEHQLYVEIVGPEAAAYEGITIEVRLADVTDPALEPEVLAGRGTMPGDRELPYEMRIGFDDADLVAGRTYGVEARVWQGRTLLFVTLEPLVIDPLTDEPVEVRVDPPLPFVLAGTRWIDNDFGDGPLLTPEGEPYGAILTFLNDDNGLSARFGLSAGCGSWTGKVEYAGIRFVFTDVFEYILECAEEPTRFAEMVGGIVDATRTYAVAKGVLELRDAEGNVLARFMPFVLPEE